MLQGGGGLLPRLIKRTTENFACVSKAKEIEEFFSKNNAPGCERALQQSCESIRVNAAWLARDKEAVKAFLAKY